MEKFIYDDAIDNVLEIIESRINYYDCLIQFDKADIVEFEIIEELENLVEEIGDLKYYREEE